MLIEAALLPRNVLNEGNQILNFILCLLELFWFHFITVPVRLRFRLRFRNTAQDVVEIPGYSNKDFFTSHLR
jgi:hypothetical protein